MMDRRNIQQCFETGDAEWTRQFLVEARQANQTLYSSQASVDRIRDLFSLIVDDLTTRIIPVETIKDYCYELLNYCAMSNDWRDWAHWAESITQQLEPPDRIWLLYGWGLYLEQFGQYAQSLDKHQAGLSLCDAVGDQAAVTHWRGSHYLGQGIVLQRTNRFEEAEYCLNTAVALFEAEQDLYKLADTLANLASCYDRRDKHKLAIARYEDSIRLLRQIDNRFDLGRVLYSAGIAYTMDHQFDSARSAFQEAQQVCGETGNTYSLILSHYGMALLQYRLREYPEARLELEESFGLFRQQNLASAIGASFPETQGNLYLLAGAIYVKLQEFDTALKYLEQAEQLYEQIDNSDEPLAKVLANQARVYELSKNYSEAEGAFWQLVKVGRQLHSPLTCGDGGVHLFRIYRKRRASIGEWIKLISRLGPYPLYGTVLGFWERWRQSNGVQLIKDKNAGLSLASKSK